MKTLFEERLAEAEIEAKRFIERCKEYRNNPADSCWPSKERAAVKRAALDTGRALSQINKSEYR